MKIPLTPKGVDKTIKKMNKREAKIEALNLASIVINELASSDVCDNKKVKIELNNISISLSIRANKLINQTKP